MVTFLFQGDQLKGSIPRPTSLSCFQARDKKVHPDLPRFRVFKLGIKRSTRTFLFPKIIKDGDGEVAFVLAFVPPAFDGFLGLG